MEQSQKYATLIRTLNNLEATGLVLIFTETKRNADNLEYQLTDQGYPASSIHGDKTQREREDALRLFKTAKTPILVATDVAARGLDINNVTQARRVVDVCGFCFVSSCVYVVWFSRLDVLFFQFFMCLISVFFLFLQFFNFFNLAPSCFGYFCSFLDFLFGRSVFFTYFSGSKKAFSFTEKAKQKNLIPIVASQTRPLCWQP